MQRSSLKLLLVLSVVLMLLEVAGLYWILTVPLMETRGEPERYLNIFLIGLIVASLAIRIVTGRPNKNLRHMEIMKKDPILAVLWPLLIVIILLSVITYAQLVQRCDKIDFLQTSLSGEIDEKYYSDNHALLSVKLKTEEEILDLEGISRYAFDFVQPGMSFDKESWSPNIIIEGREYCVFLCDANFSRQVYQGLTKPANGN